ncbi:hypothetical protein NPIL_55141 [Nephila pilipes]|uniref:Uncharacterized protein n=1 Tax=Nephila pilipes TaxID=299642 RepID=A0A8X6I7V1_NEPPI|nr:hypothetical protein NPIL_55141 [Nephila pilipes]
MPVTQKYLPFSGRRNSIEAEMSALPGYGTDDVVKEEKKNIPLRLKEDLLKVGIYPFHEGMEERGYLIVG